jgi:hypothetical protein
MLRREDYVPVLAASSRAAPPARSRQRETQAAVVKASTPSLPFPSFEIIRSVCRCGLENSHLFYQFVAEASFKEFAEEFGLHPAAISLMGFKRNKLETKEDIEGLKECCLMNLRTGGVMSVSVFQTDERDGSRSNQPIVGRRYPEALAGPSNRVETLYWAY